MLAHKISINGETLDYKHEQINIHDYAEFEKSEDLIPEFRLSIKSKVPQLVRQQHCSEDDETTMSAAGDSSSLQAKKARSFQDIARQVCMLESALKKWPRRPRSRHHSSSSEDHADSDGDTDNLATEDTASIHTDISDLSTTVDQINVQLEDVSLRSSVNNSSPAETGVRQRLSDHIKSDSETATLPMHEQGVGHEHGSGEKATSIGASKAAPGATSKKNQEKKRCPRCVLI